MKILRRFSVLLVVAVILGVLSAGAVWAKSNSQTPPPTDFTGPIGFAGKVQSLPAPGTLPTPTSIGMWKIQGLNVDVTADTKVEGSPQVGSIVKVSGTLSSDGVVHASAIAAIKGKIEFTGFVQSMPADGNVGTWTIAGLQVTVTADTEVEGSPVVGSFVKVEGTVDDAGNIVAKEIEVHKSKEGKGLALGKDHEKVEGKDMPEKSKGLALGKGHNKDKGGDDEDDD